MGRPKAFVPSPSSFWVEPEDLPSLAFQQLTKLDDLNQ
jgi:hypothetical protein